MISTTINTIWRGLDEDLSYRIVRTFSLICIYPHGAQTFDKRIEDIDIHLNHSVENFQIFGHRGGVESQDGSVRRSSCSEQPFSIGSRIMPLGELRVVWAYTLTFWLKNSVVLRKLSAFFIFFLRKNLYEVFLRKKLDVFLRKNLYEKSLISKFLNTFNLTDYAVIVLRNYERWKSCKWSLFGRFYHHKLRVYLIWCIK